MEKQLEMVKLAKSVEMDCNKIAALTGFTPMSAFRGMSGGCDLQATEAIMVVQDINIGLSPSWVLTRYDRNGKFWQHGSRLEINGRHYAELLKDPDFLFPKKYRDARYKYSKPGYFRMKEGLGTYMIAYDKSPTPTHQHYARARGKRGHCGIYVETFGLGNVHYAEWHPVGEDRQPVDNHPGFDEMAASKIAEEAIRRVQAIDKALKDGCGALQKYPPPIGIAADYKRGYTDALERWKILYLKYVKLKKKRDDQSELLDAFDESFENLHELLFGNLNVHHFYPRLDLTELLPKLNMRGPNGVPVIVSKGFPVAVQKRRDAERVPAQKRDEVAKLIHRYRMKMIFEDEFIDGLIALQSEETKSMLTDHYQYELQTLKQTLLKWKQAIHYHQRKMETLSKAYEDMGVKIGLLRRQMEEAASPPSMMEENGSTPLPSPTATPEPDTPWVKPR